MRWEVIKDVYCMKCEVMTSHRIKERIKNTCADTTIHWIICRECNNIETITGLENEEDFARLSEPRRLRSIDDHYEGMRYGAINSRSIFY